MFPDTTVFSNNKWLNLAIFYRFVRWYLWKAQEQVRILQHVLTLDWSLPFQMSEYSKKNVCFVMFVDEETLSTLSKEGNAPDDGGFVGLWKLVVVKNLPYTDMRKTGKVPKFLTHRLFPSSRWFSISLSWNFILNVSCSNLRWICSPLLAIFRYSIWLDSKLRLATDPMLIIDHFLWQTGSEYAISNHYTRHCVWEEVLQNKRLNKYDHTAIDEQFSFYQSDGLTKFDPSDPNLPLPSCMCHLMLTILSYSRCLLLSYVVYWTNYWFFCVLQMCLKVLLLSEHIHRCQICSLASGSTKLIDLLHVTN